MVKFSRVKQLIRLEQTKKKKYIARRAKSKWQECGKNVINFVLKNVEKKYFFYIKNVTRTWKKCGILSRRMWGERGKHEQLFV